MGNPWATHVTQPVGSPAVAPHLALQFANLLAIEGVSSPGTQRDDPAPQHADAQGDTRRTRHVHRCLHLHWQCNAALEEFQNDMLVSVFELK